MSGHYIDPRGKVFAHVDRLAAWRAGEHPAPVTLEVDLTNRCSHGCQSCHFAHTHTRGPWAARRRALTVATGDMADAAVTRRWVAEAASAGVKAVVWTGGGEPTLHPEWLDLMRAARGAGLQQGMYTVGTHLAPDTADALATLASWVVVSLDAIDPITYAAEKGVPEAIWRQAVHGVRMVSARPRGDRAVVGVSFLLHAENWTLAPEMVRFGLALGADYVSLRPTIDTLPSDPGRIVGERAWIGRALPMLEDLAQQDGVEADPRRFLEYASWGRHPYATCRGVRLNATITPDARLWLCPNRRGEASALVGDLTTESFATVWARHPGSVLVERACRAMCRLHPINQTLDVVEATRQHEAFL